MQLTNDFEVSLPVDQAWVVLTDVERIAPCLPGAELREVEGDEYRGVVKVRVGPITAEYKGKASFVEVDPVVHHAVLRAQGRDTRGQGNASATISATLEPRAGSTHVSVLTELTISGRVAQFGRGVLAEVSNKLMSEFVERLEASLLSPDAAFDDSHPIGEVATQSAPAGGSEVWDGATQERSSQDGGSHDGASQDGGSQDEAAEGSASHDTRARDATGQDSPNLDGAGSERAVRVVTRPEAAPVDLVGVAGWPVLKKALPAALTVLLLSLLVSRLLRKRAARRG